MDPERYARVSELFQRALELEGGDLEAFLERECQDDAALRAEVELMLQHDATEAGGLDVEQGGSGLAAHLARATPAESALEEPEQIGPYRVLERIGEGGMGTVYRCEQREPIQRVVALKLIKLGMDSEQILRRFELEREALSRMDHPNIARVLDAGTTGSGRPYFAMEYVEGRSLLEFCDEQGLDVADRLRVFVDVARAIQHAHQKGVLHRDIKPSNVLVTTREGRPEPKVIDFGLARAIEPGPGTRASLAGQVLGTPAYMSPEQAHPGPQGVDSRTDVYSLGVLLYELLTGQLPFQVDLAHLATPSGHPAANAPTPARPSSRISDADASSSKVAARRATSTGGLRRKLRGDLDWIVLKAMNADVERRYASVSELAADLEAFLDLRPVEAGPPSKVYRLRKFYQRQRVLAWGGTVFVVALIVGLGVTTWLYDRAKTAESEALELVGDVSAQNEILQHMLETADPREVGKDALVVDMLQRGMEYTLENHADKPRVAAVVLASLGGTMRELGAVEEAVVCLEASLEMRLANPGARFRDLSYTMNALAMCQKRVGDYASALATYEELLRIAESETGLEDSDMRSIAATSFNLANVYLHRGNLERAEELMLRSIALQEEYSPDDRAAMTFSSAGMASLLWKLDRGEEALPYYESSLGHARVAFPAPHPYLANSLLSLGQCYGFHDRDEEALDHYEQALAMAREINPETSLNLKPFVDAMARYLTRRNEFERAQVLAEESLAITVANGMEGQVDHAISRFVLAEIRLTQGDWESALPVFESIEPVYVANFGDQAEGTRTVRNRVKQCRELQEAAAQK